MLMSIPISAPDKPLLLVLVPKVQLPLNNRSRLGQHWVCQNILLSAHRSFCMLLY